MERYQLIIVWVCLLAISLVSIIAALMSPLLEWRQPVYIIAGLAGVLALALLLFQPLLASGLLPGIGRLRSRFLHQRVGISLVLLVVIHVLGLWLTSPPDVVDALLFRSPTRFSLWGVIAMWALFISACLVAFRGKIRLNLPIWRVVHRLLAVIIVSGTVAHAMLIDGTMEPVSKLLLCVAVLSAMLLVLRLVARKR